MSSVEQKWKKAKGSCGYNVDAPVYGQQYKHRAIFAWESRDKSWWTVSIPGLMGCGGKTRAEATLSAVEQINDSASSDYDEYINPQQFNNMMNDTEILGFVSHSVPSHLEDDYFADHDDRLTPSIKP